MRKPSAQVFENRALKVGEQGFAQRHFDRLERYHERLARDKARHAGSFSIGHNRVQFHNWVGVIQVNDLTIEVLPKTDEGQEGIGDDPQIWRGVLMDMLRRSGYLKLELHDYARLRLQSASLLDIYLEAFLEEVQALVHHGLARKYRRERGNVGALKGRLLFTEQIRKNLVHRERFFTEHQRYDRDNLFNRILKSALAAVGRVARSPHLAAYANRLLLSFEDVTDMSATAEHFRRLAFCRNTEPYRAAIGLAELILLNYSPDLRGGGYDVLAILFEMNDLFEHYVLAELKRAGQTAGGFTVAAQESSLFWRAPETQATIRPDIVLEFTGGERIVLDTKWKVPDPGRPADADLKQMYAYNMLFGTRNSYLVYPAAANGKEIVGNYAKAKLGTEGIAHHCGMLYAALLDNAGKLDRDFGRHLIEKLRLTGKHEELQTSQV